jgi:hypothetical protein
MQNPVLKFLSALILTVFICPAIAFSQSGNELLTRADSLFLQKRYTQSFEIYHTLFKGQQYSPAMLLKMAYIQEGLNRISQSAYYLNLYYLATQDEAALTKLEELADKYRLEGYATNQIDQVFSIYHRYRDLITISLISVFTFLLILMSVQRLWYNTKPVAAWVMLIVLSALFIVHLHFSEGYSKAIIVNNNTYLMDAPSAGASVISILRDGHRIRITGKKDVWLRVQWGDTEAYIKENNLMPVKL